MLYDRFTDRARKVMAYARQEAQRFNHDFIATEHILLGLIREGGGVAANALRNLGVDLDKTRAEVEKLMPVTRDVQTKGQPPFTPRAKKVIEYSLEEARALGNNYIGTEHILLGLLREKDGLAASVLNAFGLNVVAVRSEVRELLGTKGQERETAPSGDILDRKAISCVQEAIFADSARDILTAAVLEARRRGNLPIDADLLALALFSTKPNAATRALQQLGIEPSLLYNEIREFIPAGSKPAKPTSEQEK